MEEKKSLNIITNSTKKLFATCPRAYQYRILDQYSGLEKARNLIYGSAVHKGLEVFWNGKDTFGDSIFELSTIEAAKYARLHELDPFDVAEIIALISGYCVYWKNFASMCKTIAVELPFQLPLRHPVTDREASTWVRSGKIDAIIQDQDGVLCVLEHKTSSEYLGPNSIYRERLKMDSQVSIYMEAAREMGYDVQYCLYDVLRKPDISPKKKSDNEKMFKKDGGLRKNAVEKDEEPNEYYERLCNNIVERSDFYYHHFDIHRLPEELEETKRDVWSTVTAIENFRKNNYFPRNPDSCNKFGRKCEYMAACLGYVEINDDRYFKRTDAHEELKEEVTPTTADPILEK